MTKEKNVVAIRARKRARKKVGATTGIKLREDRSTYHHDWKPDVLPGPFWFIQRSGIVFTAELTPDHLVLAGFSPLDPEVYHVIETEMRGDKAGPGHGLVTIWDTAVYTKGIPVVELQRIDLPPKRTGEVKDMFVCYAEGEEMFGFASWFSRTPDASISTDGIHAFLEPDSTYFTNKRELQDLLQGAQPFGFAESMNYVGNHNVTVYTAIKLE